MKIRLYQDSRNFEHYRHFGQTVDFPKSFNVDSSVTDAVQPIGDVKCTEFTTYDIATDKNGITYVEGDLFNRVPNSSLGAVPQVVIGKAISKESDGGLLPKGQTERIRPFSSYWAAHKGNMDAFDNVRSALMIANLPVAVWTNWYTEYVVGKNGIMPVGKKALSGHMYDISGWEEVNGEPMFIVQAWLGYTMYMPRETFNHAVSQYGCGTAVLSDQIIDAKREKTILETIKDLCINTILILKQLIALKNPPPVVPEPAPVTPKTKAEELYDVSYALIGKHLTLNDTVPKHLGCCQALSYVLKKAGYNIPEKGISHTSEMKVWLDKNFKRIPEYKVGGIILSVTGEGTPGSRGHTGVCGKYAIMSNDSNNGLWKTNWNKVGWKAMYQNLFKMPTYYYEPS